MDRPKREPFQEKGQPSPFDHIKQLVPDAPAEVQALFRQLKSREAEIDRWFQEDPERLEALKRDPRNTLEELLKTMRLERPRGVDWAKIRNWELVYEPPKPPPVGSALLVAVWQFVAQSPNNLAQFKSDPFKVVNDVAAATSASQAERDAVIAAFETVTGRRQIVFDPLSVLHDMALEARPGRQPITAKRIGSA